MPSIDKGGPSSKKRLGRGLSSLLTTSAADFEQSEQLEQVEQPKKTKATKNLKPKKAVQEPSPRKQNIETSPAPSVSVENRVLELSIEKVRPNPTQPRRDFQKEALAELASSIKEQGVLQPITVRKKEKGYEIIAGERRWRASQLAGRQSIPAIVKEVDDQKSMELALIENLQREDLNPLEEALGYQSLVDDYQLNQQQVALKVGKSRSAIANSLRILGLPRDVKEMIRQNLLSFGHGKVLLGVEDQKESLRLARKVLKKKLSVRALEKEVSRLKYPAPVATEETETKDSLVSELSQRLQKSLGTRVQIQYAHGKGKLQINFYSDEELNNIAERITNS